MAKTPVIKIENLVKKFDLGAVTVNALNGVTLEIYSGEFVIFFGPSGCGKSTLMSMIAGLQPPTSGKILIRGEDLSKLSQDELAYHRRTKIGMVFQAFNLITSMNVLENIALPLTFARIPKRRRMARAANLLDTVGLSDYKYHTPSELSGGQQQKIALARSLVANPWIILADEPTGNLDSKSSNDVMRLLIKLNRKSKRTVILITHNPDYLIYADRVFHLKDGRVIDVEVNTNAKTDVVETSSSIDHKKSSKNKTPASASNHKSSVTSEDNSEEEPEEKAVVEKKSKTKSKRKGNKLKVMRFGK